MADTDYSAVLLEQIVDQNKAVLEAVGDIQRKVATLADAGYVRRAAAGCEDYRRVQNTLSR